MAEFTALAAQRHALDDPTYETLWQWSVDHPEQFWRLVWEWFDLSAIGGRADGRPLGRDESAILIDRRMPGARWFEGVELNYVDRVLAHTGLPGAAVIGISEDGERQEIPWSHLPDRVAAVAAELASHGVGIGDVVAGYLPDVADAVIAFLATASLGAIWSACGQDYAPAGAAARLGQLRPRVLFTADGYRYNGRYIDKRSDSEELATLLPGSPVHLRIGKVAQTVAADGRPVPKPTRVPFDHPLWVLFSSGTTGRPKGIVHGHGGVLVEHLKAAGLHGDIRVGDVFFWQTALSWMMWNYRLAGLLCGATIVCYSGSPLHPDADRLWQILAQERVTYFGTSPGQLQASRKAGLSPGRAHDLSALRTLGSTGSALAADLFEWVETHVAEDVPVSSISGGTDVVTAFAGGSVGSPVVAGELSVRYLGVALQSWSPAGRPLVDEVGEMVITAPMPSMPVSFWDDPDGSRYRAAYFAHEWTETVHEPTPVWRHGDWVTLTGRGSVIIHGRSDATLNRHGIRMGSADIYEVVESIDEIAEAFVLGVDGPDDGYWMPLFVTLVPGAELDDALRTRITAQIRTRLSPRHVPDEVIEAPGIPHTRTGKKLEIPVTAILAGRTEIDVDPRAVDDFALMDFFVEQGHRHRW